MTILSVRTGATLALFWACLAMSMQAHSDGLPQTVAALAPEHRLLIPEMKVDAFSGGRAILISGSGIESVSLKSIPRQSVPVRKVAPMQQAAVRACVDYAVVSLNLPGAIE